MKWWIKSHIAMWKQDGGTLYAKSLRDYWFKKGIIVGGVIVPLGIFVVYLLSEWIFA